jgi:hypothetical protein
VPTLKPQPFTLLFPMPGTSCDELKAARKRITAALRCTTANCGEGWADYRFGDSRRLLHPLPAMPPPPPIPEQPLKRTASFRSGMITTDDYPPEAAINGEEGTVVTQFVVGADGRVSECKAESVLAQLNRTSCAIILRRFRFHPATDAAGIPIAESKTQRIVWRLPFSGDGPWPARKPAVMKLKVDGSGTVTDCKATTSSGHPPRDNAICAYIEPNWTFGVSDKAMRTVSMAIPVLPTLPVKSATTLAP